MYTDTTPKIAFDDLGEGDITLLHMPGWCANRTVFRPMLPLAAMSHRAIALDWRGHGGSGRPVEDLGEAELVADALSVLECARVDRVVPVALAHSGWVAIELRRRLGPERVPGIVLLDWMPLGAPAPFFGALDGLQDPQRWSDTRGGLFSMWTTGVDLPALDAHIAEMGEYGQAMWSRAGREIANSFATHGTPVAALEALVPRCPALHVYAQPADEAVLHAQRAYSAEHPWFRVSQLDARSHFPMFEVPEHLQSSIDGFVASLSNVSQLLPS